MIYKQDYWYIRTSEVILLYSLRHHIIIFDRYSARYLFRELSQPLHSAHHSLPPVRKCSNVRCPMNFHISDYWTALTSIYVNAKSAAASPYTSIQRDVNDMRRRLIDVRVRLERSIVDDDIEECFYHATLCMRKRGLCRRPVSVRLSFCPTRWCIVSRLLKTLSNLFSAR